MDNKEIALQLTLKAIESNIINVWNVDYSSENWQLEIETANGENATQLLEFYNNILTQLDDMDGID